jgi:hypothetical protein
MVFASFRQKDDMGGKKVRDAGKWLCDFFIMRNVCVIFCFGLALRSPVNSPAT